MCIRDSTEAFAKSRNRLIPFNIANSPSLTIERNTAMDKKIVWFTALLGAVVTIVFARVLSDVSFNNRDPVSYTHLQVVNYIYPEFSLNKFSEIICLNKVQLNSDLIGPFLLYS